GSGFCFETTAADPTAIDEKVSAGSVNQQWAILSPTAPAFPTGLSAVAAGSTTANLTWNAVTGATTYNVKRSTNSGGAYTTIATGVTITNFTDATLTVGVKYFYVVSAVVGGVESANSAEATMALPFPWVAQDVGSVGVAGNAAFTYSNNVFSLTGSGSDIWNTADAFRFVYVPVTGNCTVVARVLSLQYVDVWSKAGVMIRESLNANSAHAFVAVTPGNGVAWQYRSTTGGNSSNNNTTGLNAPYWVRLVRSGNTFTGYRSPDGTNWTQIGSTTINMASAVYAGLALTSHNNSTSCTVTFDNVTVPSWPSVPVPSAPTWISATIGDGRAVLNWASSANATGYNLKRSSTNSGPYTVVAANTSLTTFTNIGLANGTVYYYVVAATNSAGESANSTQLSVQPVSTVPPTFSYGVSANHLQLTWPADHRGWRLEAQTNALSTGFGTNWFTVPGSTTTNLMFVPIDPSDGSVFFRLAYP
ncbi:MAG: DUF1349 domain-containing protein, partial [Verrucomicrobia bacterium]